MLVPMALIMVVFYFLLIRPQQKRLKQHQEMIGNVRRGDTIVTSGGLVGKVSRVTDDNEVLVDLAENVQVRLVKSAISDVRVKGEPVKTEAAASKPGKK
jgi:preprotein translocase subunit YajC